MLLPDLETKIIPAARKMIPEMIKIAVSLFPDIELKKEILDVGVGVGVGICVGVRVLVSFGVIVGVFNGLAVTLAVGFTEGVAVALLLSEVGVTVGVFCTSVGVGLADSGVGERVRVGEGADVVVGERSSAKTGWETVINKSKLKISRKRLFIIISVPLKCPRGDSNTQPCA